MVIKFPRFSYWPAVVLLLLPAQFLLAQATDSVLLFSYFKGNGEDGLHFAYSKDGLSWTALRNDQSFLTPAVANDKLMRDPCIARGPNGEFHLVWTVSWNDKGIGYASSKDLINWSAQEFLPVMQKEPTALNTWAPELFYDTDSRQFMLYWSSTIPGRFKATDGYGDDNYNHRIYYTLTRDFKTFTPTALLYDKGFNVIDASIYKAGQQYIMLLKDETLKPEAQKNIRTAVSQTLTGPYSAPSAPISGKTWAEGPTMIHHLGYWWLYYDQYSTHRYACQRSADLKTWENLSQQLKFPAGARHGTVIKISAEEFKRIKQP
ncbi:glycoside hydrolase family 43 protein [Flavihumibacter sp. CACIAM 22H1]|uniref:glycoside hydrolase family 43 protein n=1 Tax=Flavihumibacter sp. CACIAM 22H1 TaxID=1812911 RepID=UPI0007A920C2|nr:glycoside hydrolase family 43 protein [Flavihumibacter sp. CACIAM 22H1]KYP16357.1 MAG: beta-galactosidase [Flavihumibacter sp. CACIAM 22H1]